jgi:RNA polymerase sigma factor (sigma-70 family)
MLRSEKGVARAAGARPGDGSIDELYRVHGDWLRAFLQRRLRMQLGDAEDIVQDTYARAAGATMSLSHPRAFLTQIALNLFRDRHRRQTVRRDHARSVVAARANEAPPFGLSEQEAALQLERLVVEMPKPYRDVFALSRFRHMTNRDIATHLGLSIKTVEWRMGKALEFCMSRLRD